jgi:hypothetical protein
MVMLQDDPDVRGDDDDDEILQSTSRDIFISIFPISS